MLTLNNIFKTTNAINSLRCETEVKPFTTILLFGLVPRWVCGIESKIFRKRGQKSARPNTSMSCVNIKASTACTLTQQHFQALDVTQPFTEDGHLGFHSGKYGSRSGAHSVYRHSVKTDDLLPSKDGKIQTHSRLASLEN